MTHRLDPLLRPRSVAIVGASARPDSMGEWALKNLLLGGYRGTIYPINPGYDDLQGHRCYASLRSLPETPDLVVFAVADHRIESSLDEAIAEGVPAAVIQSTLFLDEDTTPSLQERIRAKVQAAGMLVCGANGMGFYNVRDHVWTCGFDSTMHKGPGNTALICHSGSGMSGIIDCDERIRVNVAVSAGNELSVTMDEYLDFVLDLPETRVVGLFVETARNPSGFQRALEKAAQRGIPIVALKVGRTARSAALAVSHSGAMAGVDATYEALFDRYGVQRAYDQDEFATMLIMFAEMHPVGAGGLVTLHDSGGERQLLVDLADSEGVPLTELAPQTVAALEEILDPELPAVNPLDAWSRGGPNAREQMTRGLSLMMQDAGAALGGVIHDRAPGGKIYRSYLEYMREAKDDAQKPVALVAARQGTGHDEAVVSSTHDGYPVLDGVSQFLRGVRALFAYRDFRERVRVELEQPDGGLVEKWRQRLCNDEILGEAESLAMFSEFGVRVVKSSAAGTADEAAAAARETGFPVVLKTANKALHHKSDVGGVVVGINDEQHLRDEYAVMSAALGDDVLIAPVIEAEHELFLGMTRDPQFGPVILLGFGGVLAETIKDIQFLMPPFGRADARRCIDRMRLRPLLDGLRGGEPGDIDSFCEMAETFSIMVHSLADVLGEVDINPVLVNTTSAIAVDGLVRGRKVKGNADT